MKKIYKAKYIISDSRHIFENAYFVVENGKIENILETIDFNLEEVEFVDYGDAVISSGFINLHTHLQFSDLNKTMSLESEDFAQWIIELMGQYSKLSRLQKITSFKNGLKEAVLSGCTCLVQLGYEEAFLEILNSSKVKFFVFLELFSNSEKTSVEAFEKVEETIKIIEKDKREGLTLGISPHSIYNVHPALWKKISQYALEKNLLVHSHLAESQDEIDWLNKNISSIDKLHKFVGWNKVSPYAEGLSPVSFLEKLGVLSSLGSNLVLAHCIQLNKALINKLLAFGVKLAHCPRSNMYLHGQTLELKENTENIGLGTDSKFSNEDLNILKEAKFVKDRNNLDFERVFDMLSINSAKILKIDNKTGTLEKGKDADFIVFNLSEGESYKAILDKTQPEHVFVKGKQIVENRNFID